MAETFNQRLELLTQKFIDNAVVDITTDLQAGRMTHEDYKFATGRIHGLNTAKLLLNNALKQCQQN